MKNLFLTGLAIILFLPACKKKDPEASLPAATQMGANTGGCLINGQPFVATTSGGNLLSNPTPALFGGFAFDSVYYVQLNGKLNNERVEISLFIRSDHVGTYPLDKDTQYYPQATPKQVLNHATYRFANNQNEVYVTDAQHTGQVVLTYANVATGISAGTFEFTAASQADPTKTVTITNGRFDRKQ